MSTLTLQPAEADSRDCYISNAFPETPNNTTVMVIGSRLVLATAFQRALLGFSLSSVPDGAFIDSAKLTITLTNTASALPSPQFLCRRLTRQNWTEAATWNNYDGSQPWSTPGGDFTADDQDSYVYPGSGMQLVFSSLKPMIERCLADSLPTLDMLVSGPEEIGATNDVTAASSGTATAGNRPKLEIEYHLPIHLQCAHAVRDRIAGLLLPGFDVANLHVRKVPGIRDDDAAKLKTGSAPTIVISTHMPVAQTPATNLSDDVTYPVTVNLFAPSNAHLQRNQGRMLQWRETIRREFHQKRISVDRVWMCQVPPSQPFNESWFVGGMQDMSALQLNFINRELR